MAFSRQALDDIVAPRRKCSAGRSAERLRFHYVVERQLADRLRHAAGPEERQRISATMYDDLFRLVPDHPRLTEKAASTRLRERDIRWNMAQLAPYLRPGCTLLEVGAGDCALAARVAADAGRVYAVDISAKAQRGRLPANVTFVPTNGRDIDVPGGSVDLAFSDQLMEHLHPDDAVEQLRNIHRALKPGGVYLCVTPNRLYGPSDVSGYFEDVACGFHLREYTVGEIRAILREAGFPRAHVYIGARGFFLRCPATLAEALETTLEWLPARVRRWIAKKSILRALLGVRVAGIKG
jgi:SAM-dependent methyltransferase